MPKEKNQDTQPLIQAELEGYSALLADIRALISQAQGRAYQAVDNIRVQTYWQIGERIVRAELEHNTKTGQNMGVMRWGIWRKRYSWRSISSGCLQKKI